MAGDADFVEEWLKSTDALASRPNYLKPTVDYAKNEIEQARVLERMMKRKRLAIF